MKALLKLVLFMMFLGIYNINAQTVILSDNFDSYSNGVTAGSGSPAAWTVGSSQTSGLNPGRFAGINTRQFTVFNFSANNAAAAYLTTRQLTIDSYASVSASVRVKASAGYFDSGDYVRVEYRTNGSSTWTRIYNTSGEIARDTLVTVSGVTGNTFQFRLVASNSDANELYFFDDIQVTATTAEPQLWFKADQNVTLASNNTVTSWRSTVQNVNLTTTTFSNNGPHFISNGFNFNPTIRFDGNDQAGSLISSTLINPSTNTCFIVQRFESGYNSFFIGQRNVPSPFRRFSVENANGRLRMDFPNDRIGSGRTIGTTPYLNEFKVFAFTSSSSQNMIHQNYVLDIAQNRTATFVTGEGEHQINLGASESVYYGTTSISEFVFFDRSISGVVLDTWYSYFGLKYGITIKNNGGSFAYRNSDEDVVWNTGTTYHNDVAAIFGDAGWAFDQNIASSSNVNNTTAANTIIATTDDFTSSNQHSSRTSLNDGQFLVWGHNNGTYSAWIRSSNFNRVNRTWRVENTGSVGEVHLEVNLSNFPSAISRYFILLDNDNDFSNGIIGEYELTEGSNSRYSTSINFPSGVSYFTVGESNPDPSFWVKADAGITLESGSTEVEIWATQAGSSNATHDGTWNKPYYQTGQVNFNPGIRFFGVNDRMTTNRPVDENYSFAIVVKPAAAAQSGTRWWEGDGIFDGEVAGTNSDFGGLSQVNDKLAFGTPRGNSTVISSNPIFGNNRAHMAIATRLSNSGRKALYIDGITDNANNGITGRLTNPPQLRIGALYSNNNHYNGLICEIMAFPYYLNQNDRQRIETYFALKYGIPISKNYEAAIGTIYTVQDYGNEVFGIGRESTYGLNQKVASSKGDASNTSSNVTIATSNDYGSHNLKADRVALNNNQFLISGHNNQATNAWTTSGRYDHVARRWKVENTGDVGNVYLQINLTSYPSHSAYFLILDDDEDISNGITQTYQLTERGVNLGNYTTQINFPSGSSYFTIGYNNVNIDYGDAPNTYATLSSNNGASHVIVSGVHLGAGISNDVEGFRDGVEDATDASDDTFDDGVTFNPTYDVAGAQVVNAGASNTVRINASAVGFATIWLDLNHDGDFADTGERIITNAAVQAGNTDLTFNLSLNTRHGITYSRIRYYTTSNAGILPTGEVANGEVEDYKVYITANPPSANCGNLLNNGSFESPSISLRQFVADSNVPGWNSSTNQLEVWQNRRISNIPSQDGGQHIELNTSGVTSIYQDVMTTPGQNLYWQIYHLERYGTGTNRIRLRIGTPENIITVTTRTSQGYWRKFEGVYAVPTDQYITRFQIDAVDPRGGDGNLLDNIQFLLNDNTRPTIATTNQSVQPNNAGCTYRVSGTGFDATGTDNCSVSFSHNYDGGGSTLDGKVFPIGTTTVSWTASDPRGNTATATMQVVVAPSNLAATINVNTATTVCPGASVIFTGAATGGMVPYSYNFRVGGTSVQSETSPSYTTTTLADGNTVDVIVTDTHGCTSTSSGITINLHGAISTNAIQLVE